jgi:tetratricopeptide (TPR) repeat protein
MQRSDHSMRPPAPAATIQFHSPNACNTCHADQSPQWADNWARQWRQRDYQAPVLHRAGLVDAARKRDWTRLPEMLSTITDKDRDEVLANSLIRLLRASDDERIAPVLLAAMKDPSALIRSSAAESLGMRPSMEGAQALVAATADDTRLVRIRAAQALAGLPGIKLQMSEPYASTVSKATEEYLASITVRPDQWSSHYNLGNYYLTKGDLTSAVSSYETAIRFDPTEVIPRVNLAMAHARKGDTANAEESLRKALALEPDNAEANFNMGLLQAEMNDRPQAENHLRRAFTTDPRMAPAAYNLCVMLADGRVDEALGFCRKAAELRPREPRYAWTYAYYQNQKGDVQAAAATLENLAQRQPGFADGTLLLADIYNQQGDRKRAEEVYNRALGSNALNPRDRARIEEALNGLKSRAPDQAKQETAPGKTTGK